MRKPSSESSHLTLKMASAQVVETSVTNNSPSQDSNHPDDLFQSRYVTPGFKPFSYLVSFMGEIQRPSKPSHLLFFKEWTILATSVGKVRLR